MRYSELNSRLGIRCEPLYPLDIAINTNPAGPIINLRGDLHEAGNHAMIRFGDVSQTVDYQKGAIIWESLLTDGRGRMHIACSPVAGAPSVVLADRILTILYGATVDAGFIGINKSTPIHAVDAVGDVACSGNIIINGHKVTFGATAPATDTWAVGDICWNTGVTALGSPGWVCTTAGTSGVWTAMATVGPSSSIIAALTYTPASAYGTTSTSFVDVDATNLALAFTSNGGTLLIQLSFTGNPGIGGVFYSEATIDGTAISGNSTNGLAALYMAAAQPTMPMSISFPKTGIGAGAHTLKLQWRTTQGTANIGTNPITMVVHELKN
jgi:hypothetical protein